MTDLQPVPQQQLWNLELTDFANFTKFLKKPELLENWNSWTREDLNPWERERELPVPQPIPSHKLSMMSMVWNISTGQLGLAAWLCSLPAPAHLLISRTWETGKSP